MRHLIIGAASQVGEQLLKKIHRNNEEIIGTFYNNSLIDSKGYRDKTPPGKLLKLDITDSKNVEKVIEEISADVIYVPAANTNVDYCENNEKETELTNVGGIVNIVNAINNIKYKKKYKKEPLLIFYSTDYVFDGSLGLYAENAISNPINVYGRQKLFIEKFIENNSNNFIIIRTTGVFGPESQGKNFVSRLVKNLQNEKSAGIPDDEFGTPTYAPDLANATLELVNNIGFGLRADNYKIVNIAGKNYISRYEFAINIAKTFKCNSNLIFPIKSENLNRPAKRPLFGGLNTSLIENLIGRNMVGHIDGLENMRKLI